MKARFLLIAAVAAVSSGAAVADKDIGCGLGTQLWEGKAGVLAKVLGATTNGSFGNQTFGISSGTLGCSSDGVVKAELRRTHFASTNLDQLAAEVAAGQGESLDTLAGLYQVDAADRPGFKALLQAHYGELFAGGTTGDVLAALNQVMAADARFARYV